MRWIVLLGLLTASAVIPATAQEQGCRFLLDNCGPQGNPRPPSAPAPAPPVAGPDAFLQQCLNFYLRCHGGAFMPEGQSTAYVKSRSDMTAMCAMAIGQRNYYWRNYVNRCP